MLWVSFVPHWLLTKDGGVNYCQRLVKIVTILSRNRIGLHPVNTDRESVLEREMLRVLC